MDEFYTGLLIGALCAFIFVSIVVFFACLGEDERKQERRETMDLKHGKKRRKK